MIKKTWYNPTVVRQNGNLYEHIVSEEIREMAILTLTKNYFNYENDEDLIKKICTDLREYIQELESCLEKDKPKILERK